MEARASERWTHNASFKTDCLILAGVFAEAAHLVLDLWCEEVIYLRDK